MTPEVWVTKCFLTLPYKKATDLQFNQKGDNVRKIVFSLNRQKKQGQKMFVNKLNTRYKGLERIKYTQLITTY